MDKYKAKLIAKGLKHKQKYDFFGTYSLVTRITSIRVLIVITAFHNLETHQMDVKMTFLNFELEKEIYMKESKGFVAPNQEKKVCKIVKSLYGLKINEYDKCVYIKDTLNEFVIVYLYVDNMLIVGSTHRMIMITKKKIRKTLT